MKDKVLIKDIVIPAGTVFTQAPIRTERHGDGHIIADFGLSKDTAGSIEYDMDDEELKEWFVDLQ